MEKTRFREVYTQGTLTTTAILTDTETGVCYLFHRDGTAGGLTVLLDANGRPVVVPAAKEQK